MGRAVRGRRCTCLIEYAPLPSQKRFHASRARFRGFSGPIGSGKSQALCHEAIKLSYLNPGRTGLVGAPTYAMLRDATQTALFQILEENEIPYEHKKSESVLLLRDTGSRVLLRSLEEYERLRGTNLAWFGVDELTYTQQEAWSRLEGRLRDPRAGRLAGFAVWTPKGHDWVYEQFMENRCEGYEVTIAKAMENHHILSKVPDFYERLRRSYDEKFFRQEVMGEYLNICEGMVYEPFEHAVHVREVALNDTLPLLWALDFNVDPMCSVIAQIDGEMVYVLDEIVLRRAGTLDACEEFRQRYPAQQSSLRVYGDASGNQRSTTGNTDYQLVRSFLTRAGYKNVTYLYNRSNPLVRDRVAAVNAKLRNAADEVNLVVSPKAKGLIRDFERVAYKENSSVVDKAADGSLTHLSDALGYLIWTEFSGKRPAGEKLRRLPL